MDRKVRWLDRLIKPMFYEVHLLLHGRLGWNKRHQNQQRSECTSLDYNRGREMGRMRGTNVVLVIGLIRNW